jgi:hypothetical protein
MHPSGCMARQHLLSGERRMLETVMLVMGSPCGTGPSLRLVSINCTQQGTLITMHERPDCVYPTTGGKCSKQHGSMQQGKRLLQAHLILASLGIVNAGAQAHLKLPSGCPLHTSLHTHSAQPLCTPQAGIPHIRKRTQSAPAAIALRHHLGRSQWHRSHPWQGTQHTRPAGAADEHMPWAQMQ